MVCKKSLTTTVPSPSVAKCDLFTRVASGSNKASVFFCRRCKMYRKALALHSKVRDGLGAIAVGKLREQKDGHSDGHPLAV